MNPPSEKLLDTGPPLPVWPIALILCGMGHWASAVLVSAENIPPYAVDMGIGLLLVHWWGYRILPCYLFSALILKIGLSWDMGTTLFMNTAFLALARWLFQRKGLGKYWLPDLHQNKRFIIDSLLVPYGITHILGRLLIPGSNSHIDALEFFQQIQLDLFSVGGAVFIITIPGLLLLTGVMEKMGWIHTSGASFPPFFKKTKETILSRGELTLFLSYLLFIPIIAPFTTGWYFALIIPLWAALSYTPVVVILSTAWILSTSFMATRLLPFTPTLYDAPSLGFMLIGLVSYLFAISIQATATDNHSKKQFYTDLKSRKKDFNLVQQAFLSSPEATLISRFSDGMVMAANPIIEKILGYSWKDMIGTKTDTIMWVHTNNRTKWLKLLATQDSIDAYETEFRHKSGRIIPCIISARKFPLDNEMCIIASVRPNYASKKMEKELKRNQELYREAQKIAHMGHWELDILSNKLRWADEIYTIFEVNPAIQAPSYDLFFSLIHPDDREMVRHEFNQSVTSHTPYEIIHRLQIRNGHVKYVHEKGCTEYDERGTPLRTIGTVQDITTYKEMELEKEKALIQLWQSQKLESVGILASGIAHDFNNILSAILGYAEISLDCLSQDDPQHENIQQIYNAGNRARSLVHQLLTFNGKTTQKKEPILIKPIIEETIKFLRASLPATIHIKENISSKARIMGDTTQIHQVIMNLCTNSAHAMKNNGGSLTIDLRDTFIEKDFSRRFVDMPTGTYIKLIVEDTGHGIDTETQSCIFDPFFTTKKEGEGTGLGLSVVHGIVTSHGGQIMVYSEPNIGTSFTLFFPIIQEEAERVTEEMPSPLPRGTEHILVVDDESSLVMLLKLMLTSMGYQVTTTTSPLEALALFQEGPHHFQALITDLMMPEMTGIALAEEIQTICPQFPIIICSGFFDGLNQDILNSKIYVKTLLKPLSRRTITTTLRELLDSAPRP